MMGKKYLTTENNLKNSLDTLQRPSFSDQSSFKKLEDKLEEEEGGLENSLRMMEQSFGHHDSQIYHETSFDQLD